MRRLMTAALLCITIICTSTRAAQNTVPSPVPDAFRQLIPKDAKLILFMKNPARVLAEAKALDLGDVPPPTLREGMELPFTADKPIQADQFFIAWADELPQFFGTPKMNVATIIPADMVGKLKPNPGHSIEYQGQIAIFTLKKGDTWKMPEQAGNPLLDALPDSDLGAAFAGKDMGESMSMNVKQFLETAPMMFGVRMQESIRGSEKYGDSAVSKAIKSITKDFQNLVGEVLPTVRSTKLVTAGMNIGTDTLELDASIHLTEDLPAGTAFDEQLIDQLPPGLPINMAISGPVARWITQIEFDILEGFLISKEEQVAKFDALKTKWNTMTGLIDSGITLGMSLNTAYQWTNVQTTDGAAFIAACNAVMKDLGTLGVGITTKPTGTDSWQIAVDGLQIGRLMGSSKQEQLGIADRFGGTYGTSAIQIGDLVMAKQYPIDAPKFPVFEQDRTLSNRLKGPNPENLIVGIAADLGLMIRRTAVKAQEARGMTATSKALKATIPKEPIALNVDLSRAGDRQIDLNVDLPLKRAVGYWKRLEKLQNKQEKGTQDGPEKSGKSRPNLQQPGGPK